MHKIIVSSGTVCGGMLSSHPIHRPHAEQHSSWWQLPSWAVYRNTRSGFSVNEEERKNTSNVDKFSYTWVAFPDPVSPTRTKAWCSFKLSMNFPLYLHTGNWIFSSEHQNKICLCRVCRWKDWFFAWITELREKKNSIRSRKKVIENSLKCHWTFKNVHTFRAEPSSV